jgi:hypothetical protein
MFWAPTKRMGEGCADRGCRPPWGVLVPALASYTYLDVRAGEKFSPTAGVPVEAASMVPCVFPCLMGGD